MHRFLAILIGFVLATTALPVFAQTMEEPPPIPDEYFVGTVLSVEDESVQVRLDKSAEEIAAEYDASSTGTSGKLNVGDRVVVTKTYAYVDEVRWVLVDRYRLPSIVWLAVAFFVCAVVFAGIRGITSALGLVFSIFVLIGFTVPQITRGADPFLTAILSAIIIAVVSLTVAHGFRKQTWLALASTLLTLLIALGLSQWFVSAAKLFGLGTEEAFYLQYSNLASINLRGLLLAGIVIGVLGVLDDVTTAQTAAIKELKESARHLSFHELWKRGISIGREHIVSLVNTLALAYAGASLPLLLAFSMNEGLVPTWVIVNGEIIAEEVVRTLVGSTALVLAVPISTIVAAAYYGKRKN